MGCRPSKQATSKVRAVEHKEDFRCSCSPRKVRKHHKCASGSNLSRRISAGSGRGSSKQSLSSSHKPRSSKSADVDFPAFSTTTAVYRTSASKTSKITLRLSCDGSTLEIEQCDYDLEKVRGDGESKPRPWNSAPNLTKMRDSKSRLFRESYLPIKHSKSGWSPGIISPTCSNRGGFFHVPVQVNTPDDSLYSSGNISGYSFSVFSQGGSNYRDRNSVYQAFESTTFAGKTFGKTSLNKSNTSSKCSSGDERRPLLLDILKESHKKASLEGNINKAASAVSMENACKDRTQTCSSLDNMINELESSLAMVHRASGSSVPQTTRPYSLEVNQVDSGDGVHKPDGLCCTRYLEHHAPVTFTADQSPDMEHIPVNVISSFITCQGQPVTCVECDRNFYPLAPSPDVYCCGDQRQDNNSLMAVDPANSMSSASEQYVKPGLQCLSNNSHTGTKQRDSNDILNKGANVLIYSDGVLRSTPDLTLQNATDATSNVSQRSLHLASSIDSNSIFPLDKQDCSAGNKNPSFILSTVDKPSISLVTDEHNVCCLLDRRHMFEPDVSRPGLDRANQTVQESVANCQDGDMYRSTDTRQQFQVQNALNNLNQDDQDKTECESRKHDELAGRAFTSNNARGATSNIFPGAQNYCSDARRAQMVGIEFCENESGIRHGENFPSLLEVIDGAVRENYIILHENKPWGDGRMSVDDRTTFSHFVAPEFWHGIQENSKQEEKKRHKNLELHRVNNRQTVESGDRKQVQVCSECMTGILNESINTNLGLIKTSSQTACLSHRLYDNTSVSQGIHDCPWEVVHTLDLVDANETRSAFSHSNLEFGRQGSNETKHLNTSHSHDADRVSEDAGYLLGLLFPERANFIPPLNSNTRFSFDFEYLDESELTCSSNSDSSDNEISPLCYSLLGQPASCENYRLNLNCQLRDTEDIDTGPAITSMQSVREIIVYQRLAMMDPRVTAIEDRCADLQISLDLTSERKSFNSEVYSEDSESCFMGFPAHAHTTDISLTESCSFLAKMENPITRSSNIIHGNAPDNREGNDLGNKQDIIKLGGDITARNYSANASAFGVDVLKHDDTDIRVCENLSFPQLRCPATDTNSLYSLLAFSETPEGTRKNLVGFSNPSDVTTNQRTQVDSTSGQILIQELTSGCWHPRKNSGRRHTEQIINTGDRHHVDKTLAAVVNPRGHVITDHEWELENLISKKHTTSNKEADRRNARDNDILCTAVDITKTPESFGYRSSHELDAINSSIRAHLCDVGMGKIPHTASEKTAVLANGMQVLINSCQRQIDRINNNNNNSIDESAVSPSSLSQTTTHPNTSNVFPAGGVSTNDNLGKSTIIESDILVRANKQAKHSETTASTHRRTTELSSSCCHQHGQESLLPEHAKQMPVSHHEDAAVQQIPSIRSKNPACHTIITNTEAQYNYLSENVNCNLAAVSSNKTINGTQTFHKHYQLLDHLYPEKSTGSNAALESRSSAELGNFNLGLLQTSDSNKLSSTSSKLSSTSSNLVCLSPGGEQDCGFSQGSNLTKYPIIMGNPPVSSEIVNNVNQDETDESLHVPRSNVLSLVRYFEKVPYNRRETKQ